MRILNDNIQRQDNMLPEWIYQECAGISMVHRDAAISRQGELTKPAGALGRLEQLAIELAGLQQTDRPRANRVPIIVFAGDHGIVAQGVSAYPQEVTIAMMSNFASGGAAISVLAGELGSSLEIVDAGTLAEQPIPNVVTDKPRRGSRDFSKEEALQPEEIAFAFDCGRRAVARAAATEPDLLILGEMGIGNTTTSAAIAAALLGVGAEQMAGSGTGVDAAGRAHKARVIELSAGSPWSHEAACFSRAHPVCGRRSRNCCDCRRHHRCRTTSPSDPDRRFHRVRRGIDGGAS